MYEKVMVAMRLMGLMVHKPVECFDRIRAIVEDKLIKPISPNQHQYQHVEWHQLLNRLSDVYQQDVRKILDEAEYHEAIRHCQSVTTSLDKAPPFPLEHNADAHLSQLTYLAVRLLKPQNVVEIGVAYGITSTIVLTAMAKNGRGKLSSIDLNPLRKNAQDYIGYLIPERLRSGWQLHRGASVRVLPKLMKTLPSVDLSIHDSLLTYRNTSHELSLVSPKLSANSGVIVNGAGESKAFYEWNRTWQPVFSACVHAKTKPDLLGIAFLNANSTSQKASQTVETQLVDNVLMS